MFDKTREISSQEKDALVTLGVKNEEYSNDYPDPGKNNHWNISTDGNYLVIKLLRPSCLLRKDYMISEVRLHKSIVNHKSVINGMMKIL